MNVSDSITALRSHLYDKVTSPLWGAFLLSWCAWNYRFVMVLFSSLPISEKFNYIDLILYVNWWSWLVFGFIFPVLSSLFLIYLYPIPAKKVYRHWREQQLELKNIQKTIDDAKPLTREEEKELREAILQQELSNSKERLDREAEIKRLREALGELQQQLDPSSMRRPAALIPIQDSPITKALRDMGASDEMISRASSKNNNELSGELSNVLQLCANAKGKISIESIASSLQISLVRSEAYAEALVDAGLFHKGGIDSNGTYFVLSPEGRKWIVNHDLDKKQ